MSDQPSAGMPVPKLHWVVTNPDGTVAAEGWATPAGSGGGAGQGKDEPKEDEGESEIEHL